MRLAILSDIHSNAYALQRAVGEAEAQKVDGYVILGDVVGYLSMPFEAIEQIVKISSDSRAYEFIIGNHDLIAAGEASLRLQLPLSSDEARWSISWLKRQVALGKHKALFDRYTEMVRRHPTFKSSDMCSGLWLMHGIAVESEGEAQRESSPNVFGYDSYVRDNTWEDADRLERSYQFALAYSQASEIKPSILVGGHSHRAMLWSRSAAGVWTRQALAELAQGERRPWSQCPRCRGNGACHLWNSSQPISLGPDWQAVYINPGSVGQPRDGCPAAAMAVLDCDVDTVQFLRLDYNYKAAYDDLFKMVNNEADDRTTEREQVCAERLARSLETGEFRK